MAIVNQKLLNRGMGTALLVAAVVLVLDQWTKHLVSENLEYLERVVVLPFFSWIHLHNDGAAFSFLQGAGGWQRWILASIAIIFSGLLIYELRKLRPMEHWQRLAFALILGGALGNLTDRLRLGYVVDFVLVHWQDAYFPAFNVADSSIFVGAVIWIALMIWPPKFLNGETDTENKPGSDQGDAKRQHEKTSVAVLKDAKR